MTSSPAKSVSDSGAGAGRTNLLGLDRDGLQGFFAGMGEKPFRAKQLLQWIYQRGVYDFDAMTDLSRGLRERLSAQARIELPRAIFDQRSVDGTRKWLLSLDGGNAIELVFIPEARRGTLCVSSQVGCALDCSFCSTAQQGFARNLTAAEIVGQVLYAVDALAAEGEGRRVTNVVFMGMGEPLLNMEQVLPAVALLTEDYGLCLSRRRVTISTSGIVPALRRLADRTQISLAVSLHAANNALRDELVPINRKYPLEQLMPACRDYAARTPHRRITWEYVMLDGVNDSDADADDLARLLGDIPSKINLIPFNPFPGARYRCSSKRRIELFSERLYRAGFTVTVRRTRGDDIDGACGQLVGRVQDRTRRQFRAERGEEVTGA
ncbi:23S rRNA (adenine(2503)-C(2))-methyltransferase RlmN [Ectothiorhodospiraceae bacterium WFHF3C12]|nr:23S rRNA (adenine(2503)-C(2))-methyltransferase RlmN [Ectothiorhodospiraceae bacterium WFHF3C12]